MRNLLVAFAIFLSLGGGCSRLDSAESTRALAAELRAVTTREGVSASRDWLLKVPARLVQMQRPASKDPKWLEAWGEVMVELSRVATIDEAMGDEIDREVERRMPPELVSAWTKNRRSQIELRRAEQTREEIARFKQRAAEQTPADAPGDDPP